MPLKIATPEIQAALNAYLAANEEEAHAMSVKTELQNQFRRIAATREGLLILATWRGQPVVVQQGITGQIFLTETDERAG